MEGVTASPVIVGLMTKASGCKMFANVHLFYAGYVIDMQSRSTLPGFSTGFIVFLSQDLISYKLFDR